MLGSRLRNTDFLYGLVVYTGQDTRLECNRLPPKASKSAIDRDLNQYVLLIISIVVLLVVVSFRLFLAC